MSKVLQIVRWDMAGSSFIAISSILRPLALHVCILYLCLRRGSVNENIMENTEDDYELFQKCLALERTGLFRKDLKL